MKSAFSLLLLIAFCVSFCLTSCTTLSNRRDLYSPDKANGPWTKRYHEYNKNVWHNKILDY